MNIVTSVSLFPQMYGTIQELELEKLAGVAVDVLRSAALPRVTTTGDRHNHWRPSHVSACTFWENKHGMDSLRERGQLLKIVTCHYKVSRRSPLMQIELV